MSMANYYLHVIIFFITQVVIGVLCILYAAYFISALIVFANKNCDHDAQPLIYLTVAVLAILTFGFVKSKFNEEIKTAVFIPINKKLDSHKHILKW